jgi:voltage-gated potassium channel
MQLVTHIDIPMESKDAAAALFLLSFLGAVVSIYIILILINIFFTGRFKKSVEEARTLKKIQQMKDHYVILGGGSLGASVARALLDKGRQAVVLEKDNETAVELNHQGIPTLEGDCFDREYLETVGVKKARTVVACLNHDGDNLLLTLICKEMNPKVKVIVEATMEKYVGQMKKVGADRVVLPRKIGGTYMAEVAATM